ncbi:MAG TPA: type II toxin-antitoxin system RelE/ParE family toxin [Chthoniobacteraceae bacterium]|jgi:plasmid stabilization system protein ParE
MGWPVILTEQSRRDLEEIVRYIAHDDPSAAERLGLALVARAESLGKQPKIGIAVRGWERIRALLHGRYYVVYRCDEIARRIEVLRFWHSARDLGALKLREPEA